MTERWILIVGFGSIGRRHFSNLKSLGFEDVRLLRTLGTRRGGFETPRGVSAYATLEGAISDRPFAAVIANPTSLHVATARALLRNGVHVVLEKPVDADFSAATDLLRESSDLPSVCTMAYAFRYHPLYRRFRDVVRGGTLGRVFHLHTRQASYLPAWHPWEDYRRGYAAQADLGGGVVRTLDHDLDFVRWVAGADPIEVVALADALSGIGLEVEDTADMIFRFPGRVQAHVHLTFGRRDYERGAWAVGEEGSAAIDWEHGVLTVKDGKDAAEIHSLGPEFDLNTIYLDMLSDALRGFDEQPVRAAIPLADGVGALAMATAALESSRERRAVAIGVGQ